MELLRAREFIRIFDEKMEQCIPCESKGVNVPGSKQKLLQSKRNDFSNQTRGLPGFCFFSFEYS